MERRGSRLSRRAFVGGAGVSAAGLGLLAGCVGGGSPAPSSRRIGRLGVLAPPGTSPERIEWLREGLREYQYVEGENLGIEWRFAEGPAQYRDLAAELVALQVDIIIAFGPTIRPAIDATRTIPIIMLNASDPVGSGFVASLAHPGGNVTGLAFLATDLNTKRLQLLKESVPQASRVAVAWSSPGAEVGMGRLQEAAEALGVQLRPLPVGEQPDFEEVFAAIAREHLDGLIVLGDNLMTAHLAQIVELANRARLPTSHASKDWVLAGGLMAYGPSFRDLYRRAAYYVDRILKGAKPADLPIEQPMTFEFVVNMKTAQALGITFPHEIMLQVTEVVQ